MKATKIIGTLALITGLFVAVCTADGSKHEVLLRAIGVALTAAGAWVGGWCNGNTAKEEEQ